MLDRAYIASILQRTEAALLAGDGPALLQLAKDLADQGKSETARTNRTNKKKSVERARADWMGSAGIDPVKLFAFATLLHSATDRKRKWRLSIECALLVLRPDLGHRRGMFSPGSQLPPRLRALVPTRGERDEKRRDERREKIVRKLVEAKRYEAGPLAPLLLEIEAQGTHLPCLIC